MQADATNIEKKRKGRQALKKYANQIQMRNYKKDAEPKKNQQTNTQKVNTLKSRRASQERKHKPSNTIKAFHKTARNRCRQSNTNTTEQTKSIKQSKRNQTKHAKQSKANESTKSNSKHAIAFKSVRKQKTTKNNQPASIKNQKLYSKSSEARKANQKQS